MSREEAELRRVPLGANGTGQGLLLVTLSMLALGVIMVHSAVASVAHPGPWYARVDVRHTVFAALALMVLSVCWRVDYHWLGRGRGLPWLAVAGLAVALACAPLVYVRGIGYAVGGCHRWIRVGPAQYKMGFQPSELLKLALVIFLAAWLTRKNVNPRHLLKSVLPALLLVGGCAGLIAKEDLGTGVVIAVSALVTLLLAGVPWYYLASLIPPGVWGFWQYVTQSPRRIERFTAMIDPWTSTSPSAYQPRQSLTSILSGGWTGRGLGRGLNKLGYLPEDSTDFIFATFCEEWGFAGAMLLMGLVLMWLWHARRAAVKASDRFGQVLAGGLGFVIAVQMVLHIAVDLVAAPPTGMSLPFISAGGTALVIFSAAAALMISVTARRPVGAGDELAARAPDELAADAPAVTYARRPRRQPKPRRRSFTQWLRGSRREEIAETRKR